MVKRKENQGNKMKGGKIFVARDTIEICKRGIKFMANSCHILQSYGIRKTTK